MNDKKLINTLYEALRDAEQHLEYCGYGDRYERECARDEKLPEKIRKALELVELGVDAK